MGSPALVAQASAIAVLSYDPPPGQSREMMVSLLAVEALHEGRNNTSAIGPASCNASGDCHSYGAFQLDHQPQVLGDIYAQARYAYYIIRAGYRICPAHVLAPYAGGCHNRGAVKLADARMAEAVAGLGYVEGRELLPGGE